MIANDSFLFKTIKNLRNNKTCMHTCILMNLHLKARVELYDHGHSLQLSPCTRMMLA